MKIIDLLSEAGYYRRPGSPTAAKRDYASSISGFGRKDSLAYQQDGGGNDEYVNGDDDEVRAQQRYRAPEDKPVLQGYFFYNVQPGQENDAAIYGVKKTKNGKWAKAKYTTSGRSFDMQKDGADKAFGPGKWWTPKNESSSSGSTSTGSGATAPGKGRIDSLVV